MKDAPGKARKKIAGGTTWGVRGRRSGVCSAAIFSELVDEPVEIQPGATPLMVIPSPAVSIATARIMPSIAALAAPYAADPGLLTSGPVTEVTFTIRPYFCCVMLGRTARVIRKAVCKVIAIWCCHSAKEG